MYLRCHFIVSNQCHHSSVEESVFHYLFERHLHRSFSLNVFLEVNQKEEDTFSKFLYSSLVIIVPINFYWQLGELVHFLLVLSSTSERYKLIINSREKQKVMQPKKSISLEETNFYKFPGVILMFTLTSVIFECTLSNRCHFPIDIISGFMWFLYLSSSYSQI